MLVVLDVPGVDVSLTAGGQGEAVLGEPSQEGRGVLEELMQRVRTEFRTELIAPVVGDPVLGGAKCDVAACPRPVHARGLCQGHRFRWSKAGKPGLTDDVRTTDPVTKGRARLRSCAVPSCLRGSARRSMCHTHYRRWVSAAQPERDRWLSGQPPIVSPLGDRPCDLPSCGLLADGAQPFCFGHYQRWLKHGRGPTEEFARYVENFGIDPSTCVHCPRYCGSSGSTSCNAGSRSNAAGSTFKTSIGW